MCDEMKACNAYSGFFLCSFCVLFPGLCVAIKEWFILQLDYHEVLTVMS